MLIIAHCREVASESAPSVDASPRRQYSPGVAIEPGVGPTDNPTRTGTDPHRLQRYALLALNLAVFVRILAYSWVTDDAFITFRSVLNLMGGDGPVFNIGERVQSFTHPLWFGLMSLGGALDLNLYFWAILCGLACSALTLVVLHRIYVESQAGPVGYVLCLILLLFSESFLSFSTSGLEGSLTDLLLVSMVWLMVRDFGRWRLQLAACLLYSAALLNRFDNIFLFSTLLGYYLLGCLRRGSLSRWRLSVGLAPLLVWHAFSLVYYGFLFPNTKYAKIGARGLIENLRCGLAYLADSVEGDLHGWAVVAALVAVVAFSVLRGTPVFERPRLVQLLMVAATLHIGYVVAIAGGDFMRGRFFVPVMLLAATSLVLLKLRFKTAWAVLLMAGFAVTAAFSYRFSFCDHLWFNANGVENERNFYKEYLALHRDPDKIFMNHRWARKAAQINRQGHRTYLGVNGEWAYIVDRHVRLVDPTALTDAFIARLPATDAGRSGHFEHDIPEEYLTLKLEGTVTPRWRNQELQHLWEQVRIVTEDPDLFSLRRLHAMVWLWTHYGI
jgi:arabinofuranosyltransferase